MKCKVENCEGLSLSGEIYCATHERRWKRFRTYGFERTHFEDLQRISACEICGDTPATLNTDHDHDHCPPNTFCPICVRGMLCTRCNTLMAKVDADYDWFRKAIGYRKDYEDGNGYDYQPNPRQRVRKDRPVVERAAYTGDTNTAYVFR